MYNRMRIIYEVELSSEDRGLKYAQIKEKYKGQLEVLLQRKINPYWCPLRQEEFQMMADWRELKFMFVPEEK